MIKIDFDEPTNADWLDWKTKCEKETADLIEAFQNGKDINISTLYKEKKRYYFDLKGAFSGKCSYCESLIQNTHSGDIDHYRPKGRVRDENGEVVKINNNGNEEPHPGYYWLAYCWKNLLPSCTDCNRRRNHNTKGGKELYGKWDKFPVKKFRAIKPGEEDKEEALLINPIEEDTVNHISIDDTGIFTSQSPRGDMCIEIFGLNSRVALVEARKDKYDEVRDKLKMFLIESECSGVFNKNKLDELKKIKMGKKPYSIAARKAIDDISMSERADLSHLLD